MSAPNVRMRTYNIRLHHRRNLLPQERDCNWFETFVREKAQKGRQLLQFTPVPAGEKCEIGLQVRCPSCGQQAIHKFHRLIQEKFPNVTFVEFRKA